MNQYNIDVIYRSDIFFSAVLQPCFKFLEK